MNVFFDNDGCMQTEVDIIEDIDEYQTWPGWLILVFRSLIMVWFLFELRNTMTYEHNTQKLNFLLHFGASSLVWFIYLPIIALIALQVSALWRFKLLLGMYKYFFLIKVDFKTIVNVFMYPSVSPFKNLCKCSHVSHIFPLYQWK